VCPSQNIRLLIKLKSEFQEQIFTHCPPTLQNNGKKYFLPPVSDPATKGELSAESCSSACLPLNNSSTSMGIVKIMKIHIL